MTAHDDGFVVILDVDVVFVKYDLTVRITKCVDANEGIGMKVWGNEGTRVCQQHQ